MMDFPDWITEARVAIMVSALSATFTGFSLAHSRRLARNDTERMKRKLPAIEASISPHKELSGWDSCWLTIRNFEPVTIILEDLSAKPRKGLLAAETGARLEGENPWEPGPYIDPVPAQRSISVSVRVGPAGKKHAEHSIGPFDTVHMTLITRAIGGASDIRAKWKWADGYNS